LRVISILLLSVWHKAAAGIIADAKIIDNLIDMEDGVVFI
jgi:hypothetical protein